MPDFRGSEGSSGEAVPTEVSAASAVFNYQTFI